MLHDDRGGPLEIHDDVDGLVHVDDVVVGKFLPMEDLGFGYRHARGERIRIICGLLVGVLPVSEVPHLLRRLGPGGGEHVLSEDGVHLGGDHRIIVGGDRESLGHEPAEDLLVEFPVLGDHVPDDHLVLVRVGDDGDGLVVLGRRTDHGRAADVDVLHDVIEGGALLENGLFERIEVDDDHVYRLDLHLLDGLHVLGIVPAGEEPGMDVGMEGLHTPVQHLGESGHVGDLRHLHSAVVQELVGPAGGDYLHSHGSELFREIHYACLVRNADDCSLDLYQLNAPKRFLRLCNIEFVSL